MDIPDEFLDETIRVWQPYSKETVTREDAEEIAQYVEKCNLRIEFCEILIRPESRNFGTPVTPRGTPRTLFPVGIMERKRAENCSLRPRDAEVTT